MTDEEPLLLPTEKGFTAVWRNVQLYPPADPVESARRKARGVPLAPRTLVFVPSVGLGHGLTELLERLPESCAVLCVEAHQQIMGLAIAAGLPRDPRLIIIRTESEQAVAHALRDLGPWRFRRVVEAPLCGGYRLAPDLYQRMRRLLEEEIHGHWRNRLTLIALGSLQVRNTLTNLALLPQAGDFSLLSTTRPVVVAGAGPSLEEAIPLLRALRDSILLLAVDTALPCLMAESLTPDIVIALEAQIANLEDFLGPRGGRTLLACDLSSHPATPRLFPGRAFFFCSEFAPLRLFSRLQDAALLPCPFPPLGSVGVAAVHAALRLTAGNIFITGLDFSFPGGLTHARGAPRHVAGLSAVSRLNAAGSDAFTAIASRSPVKVPDKNGIPVVTDGVLRSYRDGLEAFIRPAGIRVHDISSSGLFFGARHATQKEMKDLVTACSPDAPVFTLRDAAPFTRERVQAFVSAEKALLKDGEALLQGSLKSPTPSPECISFLREADHTYVHFPDAPAAADPDRSFLARAGVAARYYAERLERLESLL